MSVTDFPTYDDVDWDLSPLWCDRCGRALRQLESSDTWTEVATSNGVEMVCPHCAALAEADGLEQAERQAQG